MKLKIALSFLLLSMCRFAYSEDLFQDCNLVLEKPNYKNLNKYFSENKTEKYLCQRLNDYEFIYTNDRNFKYCHLNSENSLICEDHQDSYWFPYPTIVKRFTGANGKQFVLFKTSRLSHGVYGTGYQVFYFTPKEKNSRGYTILSLANSGIANGLKSDAGQLCSNMGESDASQPEGNEFEIINESTQNVTLRFSKMVTSCKTMQNSNQSISFTWQNDQFVQN